MSRDRLFLIFPYNISLYLNFDIQNYVTIYTNFFGNLSIYVELPLKLFLQQHKTEINKYRVRLSENHYSWEIWGTGSCSVKLVALSNENECVHYQKHYLEKQT